MNIIETIEFDACKIRRLKQALITLNETRYQETENAIKGPVTQRIFSCNLQRNSIYS